MENSSRISTWTSVGLCLFVVVCYGIYLSELLGSSLRLASKYSQFVELGHTLESLFVFGKIGITAFAIVELVVLFRYVRSSTISHKRVVFYFMALIISNLLAYIFVSYLYGYGITIIGE